jgi:hypothetical protein
MTERVQVQCVTKRDRHNPHERIEGIGGAHNGKPWYLSEDEAIRAIESSSPRWQFFTFVNGREATVIVASHGGRKYLKTTADGYEPNNLLALTACPIGRAA